MSINLDLLKAEMLILKNCLPSSNNHNIDTIKDICKKDTFPNVFKLLQVALTIPVSSATCERSFLSMRCLKNWLRASMEQQRFTNLSILNIESNIANKINSSEILEKYSTKNRKLLLVKNNVIMYNKYVYIQFKLFYYFYHLNNYILILHLMYTVYYSFYT